MPGIERTERLLNLVFCLMATTQAVSRDRIEREVPGYSEATSQESFERMFERDKDELRGMGIPIETVSDMWGEVLGYRISVDDYALGEVSLTFAERAAIAVAAQAWSDAAIAPTVSTALRKLEATDGDIDAWRPAQLLGSVRLTASDAALLPLMTAIREDREVRFPYQTPSSDKPQRRRVSPWGLRASSGRWMLYGYDHDRNAPRTFRLSRVTGPVTVTANPRGQRPPDDFDAAEADFSGGGDALVTAVVAVTPRRAASLRRGATAGGAPATADDPVIEVTGRSFDALVSDLCSAGADALVREPSDVADAVRESLQRILDGHTGGGDHE